MAEETTAMTRKGRMAELNIKIGDRARLSAEYDTDLEYVRLFFEEKLEQATPGEPVVALNDSEVKPLICWLGELLELRHKDNLAQALTDIKRAADEHIAAGKPGVHDPKDTARLCLEKP